MTRHGLSIRDKLFEHRQIDHITKCWLWTLSCNKSGHGFIHIGLKKELVHRVAWREFVGPIKELICHKRECPNPNCFNPEHLYDGNYYTNAQDRKVVGTYKNNITPYIRKRK